MDLQQLMQRALAPIQAGIIPDILIALSKVYPDKVFKISPNGGFEMWQEDHDVQMDLDYYGGKRKTKANALAKQKALNTQSEQIESGALIENLMTPDLESAISEQFISVPVRTISM